MGGLKGTVPLPSDKTVHFLITGQHLQLSVLCAHKTSCACVMSNRRTFFTTTYDIFARKTVSKREQDANTVRDVKHRCNAWTKLILLF